MAHTHTSHTHSRSCQFSFESITVQNFEIPTLSLFFKQLFLSNISEFFSESLTRTHSTILHWIDNKSNGISHTTYTKFIHFFASHHFCHFISSIRKTKIQILKKKSLQQTRSNRDGDRHSHILYSYIRTHIVYIHIQLTRDDPQTPPPAPQAIKDTI